MHVGSLAVGVSCSSKYTWESRRGAASLHHYRVTRKFLDIMLRNNIFRFINSYMPYLMYDLWYPQLIKNADSITLTL